MRGPKRFDESIRLPAPGGVITRVSSVPNDAGMVTVRLGRSSAGRVPAAAAERLGARAGAPWTGELRAAFLSVLAEDKARTHAVRSAAARAMTKKQLRERLMARGVARASADAIVNELAEKGLVSDEAFADNFAGRLAGGRSIGEGLVAIKLMQRGVHGSVARTAARRAFEDAAIDPDNSALELARKRLRTLSKDLDPRAVQRRVYAFLARRGFDPQTCAAAVRTAVANPATVE